MSRIRDCLENIKRKGQQFSVLTDRGVLTILVYHKVDADSRGQYDRSKTFSVHRDLFSIDDINQLFNEIIEESE